MFFDDFTNERDIHASFGKSRRSALFLGLAVGAMVFAHDATKVAVVRISIEGDSPRARKRLDGQGTSAACGLFIDGDDFFGMRLDVGDIPGIGVEIPTPSELSYFLRFIPGALHGIG